MAQEPRRFIIHISTGEADGEEDNKGKKSKKNPALTTLNNLKSVIANPGQRIKSDLLDVASRWYGSENPTTSKWGTALNIGVQLVSETAKIATQSANMAINRYCTLQEDYMTSQAISNVRTTVDKAKGFGGSILSGAAAGLGAGPVGVVAGAVIGAASYGANQYYEYQQRMSGYYQKLNATNFETNFNASRLGLINNGRGTEN